MPECSGAKPQGFRDHRSRKAGIGRATLYKYFPDPEAILLAWHEEQVDAHLGELRAAAGTASGPRERIEVVLGTYARIIHDAATQHHTLSGLHSR